MLPEEYYDEHAKPLKTRTNFQVHLLTQEEYAFPASGHLIAVMREIHGDYGLLEAARKRIEESIFKRGFRVVVTIGQTVQRSFRLSADRRQRPPSYFPQQILSYFAFVWGEPHVSMEDRKVLVGSNPKVPVVLRLDPFPLTLEVFPDCFSVSGVEYVRSRAGAEPLIMKQHLFCMRVRALKEDADIATFITYVNNISSSNTVLNWWSSWAGSSCGDGMDIMLVTKKILHPPAADSMWTQFYLKMQC